MSRGSSVCINSSGYTLVEHSSCLWTMTLYSYFEKGCRKQMCTRQSRKVIWDMNSTLFLTLQLSNLLLLLFCSTRKHASMTSRTILSNFFKKQWTQNRPQYLSGFSRALSPTTFLEIAVYMYNKVLGIMNYFFYPMNSEIRGKELWYNETLL